MTVKILNVILISVAVYMGFKQGWAMITGKPEILEMFGKFPLNKTAITVMGIFTVLGAILILFPKTFVWGNFLMAAGILVIICFHLLGKNLKGAGIELPFFLLNLVIIYLQYPLPFKTSL